MLGGGGNPAMDQHPFQGGGEIEISSGLMGYLARMQTLPHTVTFFVLVKQLLVCRLVDLVRDN